MIDIIKVKAEAINAYSFKQLGESQSENKLNYKKHKNNEERQNTY